MVALVIGVGITLFMSSTDDLSFGYDIYGKEAVPRGPALCCSFSFSSLTASQVNGRVECFSVTQIYPWWNSCLRHRPSPSSCRLSPLSTPRSCIRRSALSTDIPRFTGTFSCFQFAPRSVSFLIFYTIKNFGAVVFTLIMTTRILLSIALSCILYGHHVTGMGFLGLMLVMGAVLYRIKRKAEGNQLFKWQGMEDDKAQELVQEWHEHVDF